jgi:hypothetical protein
MPESSASFRSSWPVYVAVFIGSGILIWAATLNDDWKDQYLHLLFGQRILHGQVPYRDFFEFTFPGCGYAIAAWFKLFGDSMEGVRVLNALLGAATVTLAFSLSRIFVAGPFLWIGPAGALSAYIVGHQGIGHMQFSLPLGMAGVLFAVHADRGGHAITWFIAGFFAALTGLFTQSIGALLGLAFVVSALTASQPLRKKLAHTGALVLSAIIVLIPALLFLISSGAWERFYYDAIRWPVDRYLPFHGGVSWGGSLPLLSFISNIPWSWRPVWVATLAIVYCCVWLVPFVPLYSLIQAVRRRELSGSQRILLASCFAFSLSIYPNGIAMRMVRLSIPLWPLIAIETQKLLSNAPIFRARIVACSACAGLLLAANFQWSDNLIELNTPRGRVRVHAGTAEELVELSRHYKPGERVLTLPDVSPADYFFKLDRPVSNDHELIPVFLTTSQLRELAEEAQARDIQRAVVMQQHFDDMMAEFQPAAHLDELHKNPLFDYLQANYDQTFDIPLKYQSQPCSMVGLRRKQ